LSDFFRVRACIPDDLAKAVQEDEVAKSLLDEEKSLVAVIESADAQSHIEIRRRADEHRAKMREHPLLVRLLDIREGIFDVHLDLEQLQLSLKLSGIDPLKVKFADWTFVTSRQGEEQIALFVRALDNTLGHRILDISQSFVQE
jgi:hypothetical protein